MTDVKPTRLVLHKRHEHPNGGATYAQQNEDGSFVRSSIYVGPKLCGDTPPDSLTLSGHGLVDVHKAKAADAKAREAEKEAKAKEREEKKAIREKERAAKKAAQEKAAAEAKAKAAEAAAAAAEAKAKAAAAKK